MADPILVVEDDPVAAAQFGEVLREDGHEVELVADGSVALGRACEAPFGMVLLDIGLPGLNGLDVVRQIRYRQVAAPVLIVSGRGGELDRVLGVELGADAYLVKPVGLGELRARVRAMLRREGWSVGPTGEPSAPRLKLGPLTMDERSRRVWRDDAELSLSVKEFDLLAQFMQAPGRVFSPAQLLQAVWHTDFAGYERNVKTFINRLRLRVEVNPSQPQLVLTVRGIGYRGVGPDG
jgi:two-component system, OmpR family, response regulator